MSGSSVVCHRSTLGTTASQWHSSALAIFHSWRPICTVLDVETATCPHCNGAEETAQNLMLYCPAVCQ